MGSKKLGKVSRSKEDVERESVYVAVNFDQIRYTTARVHPSKSMQFNEIFLFDFDLPHEVNSKNEIKFDKHLLKRMKQPLIMEVIHQRGNRIQVIGTKVLHWESLMQVRPKCMTAKITSLELDQI